MNVSKPLCCTCFRQQREPGSARCLGCGPGRIQTPRPGPPLVLSPLDRAAEQLGDAEELDAADIECTTTTTTATAMEDDYR